MPLIEVGKPLPGARPPYPEGGEFNLLDDGPELKLRYARLSKEEVRVLRRGECEFALVTDGPIVFFLYRFGRAFPWSDAPYSWHLVPADRRPDPTVFTSAEQRHLLQVIAYDAADATVYALRAVSLSPEFSRALAQAVLTQSAAPWPGKEAYAQAQADAYRRYPDSASMLVAAVARCRGGA